MEKYLKQIQNKDFTSSGVTPEDIAFLQAVLSKIGYTGKDGKKLEINGAFDENTKFALSKHKEDYKLYKYLDEKKIKVQSPKEYENFLKELSGKISMTPDKIQKIEDGKDLVKEVKNEHEVFLIPKYNASAVVANIASKDISVEKKSGYISDLLPPSTPVGDDIYTAKDKRIRRIDKFNDRLPKKPVLLLEKEIEKPIVESPENPVIIDTTTIAKPEITTFPKTEPKISGQIDTIAKPHIPDLSEIESKVLKQVLSYDELVSLASYFADKGFSPEERKELDAVRGGSDAELTINGGSVFIKNTSNGEVTHITYSQISGVKKDIWRQ